MKYLHRLKELSRRSLAILASTFILVAGALGYGASRLLNVSGADTDAKPLRGSLLASITKHTLKNLRSVNETGKELIKGFEQLRLDAYDDRTKNSIMPGDKCIGVLTIGWGHTGKDVQPGDSITKEEADRLLTEDLKTACGHVLEKVKVPLTDNQYAALVSFVYNVGGGAFEKSSLLKNLNAGRYNDVVQELVKWNKQKNTVLPGLTRRRVAEAHLFMAQDIGKNFDLKDILQNKKVLHACEETLETGLPFSQTFAKAMQLPSYEAPKDQWWLDYLNNAALEFYLSLTDRRFEITDTLMNGLSLSLIFNKISFKDDAPLQKELFGSNKEMHQAFDSIELNRLENKMGSGNFYYQGKLSQLSSDGNAYLGIPLDSARKRILALNRNETPLEILKKLKQKTMIP